MIFRQNFKNEVYLHPEKDFLTSYNQTSENFLKEMNVDPECKSYVEYQGISTDTERRIFDHLFSAKCSNPLDIVSNSNFIKSANQVAGFCQIIETGSRGSFWLVVSII